jgi:hypothetical protein
MDEIETFRTKKINYWIQKYLVFVFLKKFIYIIII